MIFSF